MVATSAAELRANARAVRARLFAPPNAVVDRGIDLRPPRQPEPAPPAPLIRPPRIIWIPHKVRISDVMQLVADYHHINVDELLLPKRTVGLRLLRRISAWLAHEVLGRSYPEIAYAMGRRHHQGMMKGVDKLYDDMKLDDGLAYDVAELELRIAALSELLIAGRPAPEPRIEQATKRSVAIARVIQLTADFYKTPVDGVLGRSRAVPVTKVRQIACFLARAVLGRTFLEIGRTIERDHSTVVSAFSKIAARLEIDAELFHDIELLKQQILNHKRGA